MPVHPYIPQSAATVQAAGLDLIWFGIFIVLVVEMAQITPPAGFNLFVIQGLAKREITYIARTAFPPVFSDGGGSAGHLFLSGYCAVAAARDDVTILPIRFR